MKGYKGFENDMTCRGFQYEVGKEYEMDCNPGNRNTGDCNTGNCNTGNRNTGDCNTGGCNTGNRNTGDCNTGDWNTGSCNTGSWNTGDWNTGDWNTTKYSAGCFNTEQQKAILFNKPSDWTLEDWWYSDARYILNDAPQEIDVVKWIYTSDMTDAEKEAHPEYKTTGGYLKVTHEAPNRQEWWDKLPEADKKMVMAIPNFDTEVFKQCTGIEVRNKEGFTDGQREAMKKLADIVLAERKTDEAK